MLLAIILMISFKR